MGGKSTSSSSSASSDNRTVAEADSLAIVGSSNVNVTDGGLVENALKYLDAADKRNSDRLSVLVQAGAGILAANQANTEAVLARQAEQETPESMQFSQVAMVGALAVVGLLILRR